MCPALSLSLNSQVSVLQDRNQSGTQGSQEYHSQYQSKYNSASILNGIHMIQENYSKTVIKDLLLQLRFIN